MLEILAIIFLVVTLPIWLPIVIGFVMGLIGIAVSLISFGFIAIFWIIFIAAVIYLIFT